MAEALAHRPVLLQEVLEALMMKADGIYVDGTFGRGGHSRAILQCLGPQGRLIAIDKDPAAIEVGRNEFSADRRFSIHRGSFAMLERMLGQEGVNKVDGILLDLGVSSPQLDDPNRGFSFYHDGPLDMRMDPESGRSAAEWLARAPEQEIAQILKEYGEERYAKRVARAIVKARREAPIVTTGKLAEIVAVANPRWEPGKHPATRSFQAIRIFINRELDDLRSGLEQAVELLTKGGRLAVISFHSLEDRIVKRFMQREARGGDLPPDLPLTQAQLAVRLRPVGKAIRAGAQEVEQNPRARSAMLRVAERVS